jgi:putative hydrolase of the HAD superfamily
LPSQGGDRSGALRALTLDVLGTLLELDEPAQRLRAELRQRAGVALSTTEAERALAAEIAYYRSHHLEGRDRESLADLRRRCADVLRLALPQRARSALSTEIVQEALLRALHFKPFGDAAAALQAARARGLKLVAVSNWDISLAFTLARVGLARLLDGVVASAAVGLAKPARAPFERALALVGVEPPTALHIGDSIQEDLLGARALGMATALIVREGGARPGRLPASVRVISSLVELPALLASAEGKGDAK